MVDEQKLASIRRDIDNIDVQIVGLLHERARLSLAAGIAKGDRAVYRPEREAQVLENVSRLAKGPLSAAGVQAVFKEIIRVCRTIQQTK